MEGQSGLSELSIISWVSAFEGCLLSRVPLYTIVGLALKKMAATLKVHKWHAWAQVSTFLYRGLFLWFTRVSQSFPPMKFSTHCVVLSTHAQIWTSDVLLWLSFTTCSPLTVSLIHRVPFLKLSHVYWLIKQWAEKCRSLTTIKKTGPVPLIQHRRA